MVMVHAKNRFFTSVAYGHVALIVGAALLLAAAFTFVFASPAHATKDGHTIVVSMGDSYSSGEGTEPFYYQSEPGLNKFYKEDFLAHRSELAWPGQLRVSDLPRGETLRDKKDTWWYFTAVSGAQSENITGKSQDIEWSAWRNAFEIESDKKEIPPQIKVFASKNLKGHVDYITITIGGNDTPNPGQLGFVPIVTKAITETEILFKGSLDDIIKEEKDYFNDTLKNNLINTYKKILDEAGPQATLIVVGYPHIFATDGAHNHVVGITKDEAARINELIDFFDDEMAKEIADMDSVVFVDPRDEFNGHEREYINEVIWGRSEQELWIYQQPPASAYSVHPNKKGQAAYAKVVQKEIEKQEKKKAQDSGDSVEGQTAQAPSAPPTDFDIVGSWKSVGPTGYGQAQPGVIVTFDGEHCNLYSPNDTYTLRTEGDAMKIDCKNWLWGDVQTLTIEVVDNDHIRILTGNSATTTELERMTAEGSSQGSSPAGEYLDGLYIYDGWPMVDLYYDFYPDGTLAGGLADKNGNVLGESLGYYSLSNGNITISIDLDDTLAAYGLDSDWLRIGILSSVTTPVTITEDSITADGMTLYLVE